MFRLTDVVKRFSVPYVKRLPLETSQSCCLNNRRQWFEISCCKFHLLGLF